MLHCWFKSFRAEPEEAEEQLRYKRFQKTWKHLLLNVLWCAVTKLAFAAGHSTTDLTKNKWVFPSIEIRKRTYLKDESRRTMIHIFNSNLNRFIIACCNESLNNLRCLCTETSIWRPKCWEWWLCPCKWKSWQRSPAQICPSPRFLASWHPENSKIILLS